MQGFARLETRAIFGVRYTTVCSVVLLTMLLDMQITHLLFLGHH